MGGWYLDSLVTPDSSTGVYTAVEVYNPWTDTWEFVSSLPLTDFQFTLSLSHDSPLTTSLGHCLYVLGNIKRTGEKLVLRCLPCSEFMTVQTQTVFSAILFATAVWYSVILLIRYILKALLSYHGWIFESHGKMSFSTKVWLVRHRFTPVQAPVQTSTLFDRFCQSPGVSPPVRPLNSSLT